MKLVPTFSRRNYIIGGTLLILFIIFGFYFLVFLPKKERNIIAQRVRALHRIEENFQEKYKVYQKVVSKGETNVETQSVQEYQKKIDQLNKHIAQTREKLERTKEGRGSYRAMLNYQNKLYKDLERDEEEVARQAEEMKKKIKEEDPPEDFLIYKENTTYDDQLIWMNNAVVTKFTPFFEPLKLRESFEGYIVYRDTALVYQEVPGEVLRVPSRLYLELNNEDPAEQRFVRQNLEARKPERYESPRVYEAGTDVQLAGIDYKLFCTHFVVNNGIKDTEWTIYGLVTEAQFESEKKKIPFFSAVYVFAGILLLLFAIPLLKLAFMSPIERLHRQDVLMIAPAFMLCSAIVTLLLLLTCNYYLYELPAVDHRLEKLAEGIEDAFDKEVDSIAALAVQFEDQSFEKQIENKVVKDSVNSEGKHINSLSVPKLISDSSSLPALISSSYNVKDKEYAHPYFRSVFWLDKEGTQQFEYTTIRKEHVHKTPNYKSRAYFSRIQDGKGYSWHGNDSSFFLESVVSHTTGEAISVFSRPASFEDKDVFILDGTHQATIPKRIEAEMLGISTILQSLNQVVLPPAYGFMIIDREGKVLYHLDHRKNLQENYLEEIDQDARLRAAMHSQSAAVSDVTYYHHEYRAHIQPMQRIPWYLVTVYNKEYIQSPYQNILMLCLLGIILLATVASLPVLLVSLLYGRRTKAKLRKRAFSFGWLWPYREGKGSDSKKAQKLSRRKKYACVVLLNVIYLLVIGLFNRRSDVQLHQTLATFLYAIIFSYATAFALLQQKRDTNYWWMLVGSVALTLLILFVTIHLTVAPDGKSEIWYSLPVSILYFSFTIVFFLVDNQPTKNKEVLAIFAISLLLMIVFALFNAPTIERAIAINLHHWLILYFISLLFLLFAVLKAEVLFINKRPIPEAIAATAFSISREKLKLWKELTDSFLSRAIATYFRKNVYTVMIFSYIFIGGCLSVWFLFDKAYGHEMLVWKKYDLYEASKGLKARDQWLKDYFHESDSKKTDYQKFNTLTDRYAKAKEAAFYLSSLGIEKVEHVENDTNRKLLPGRGFDTLVHQLRLGANSFITQTNGFVYDQGKDGAWYTKIDKTVSKGTVKKSLVMSVNNPPFIPYTQLSHPIPTFFEPLKKLPPIPFLEKTGFVPISFIQSDRPLSLRAQMPVFELGAVVAEKHPLLLLLAIGLLFGLYHLLRLTLIRLFGTNIIRFPQIIQIDDKKMIAVSEESKTEEKAQTATGEAKVPNHQFFVSMPFAGSIELRKEEEIEKERVKTEGGIPGFRTVDLSCALNNDKFQTTINEVEWKKEPKVVLENFSYGIDDPDANLRRLLLLEALLAEGRAVTIISKLTPMQITSKYEEVIEETRNPEKRDELENRVSRWKDILASFVKFYYAESVCNRSQQRLSADCSVKELVHYEMRTNRGYFERLDGTIVKEWGERLEDVQLTESLESIAESRNEDIKEEVILKIQTMAQPFYFSLWNTCSKEEKYMLYDLADDGFVNVKNKQVLIQLMEKGLIYYDESFHIMNESFRNFILTNIKPAESLAMEKELKKQGRWSTYSTIIFLLIVSLVIFMFFAQDSVVNQFTALLAGLAAVVPYIIRLGGALVPNFARSRE